jgi:predicted RNase H-like nuclease (RuvC/YqgF family)
MLLSPKSELTGSETCSEAFEDESGERDTPSTAVTSSSSRSSAPRNVNVKVNPPTKNPLDALLQGVSDENKSLRSKLAEYERTQKKLLNDADKELDKRAGLIQENELLTKENLALEREVRRLRKALLAIGSGDLFR